MLVGVLVRVWSGYWLGIARCVRVGTGVLVAVLVGVLVAVGVAVAVPPGQVMVIT